jgi:hypothetical protein
LSFLVSKKVGSSYLDDRTLATIFIRVVQYSFFEWRIAFVGFEFVYRVHCTLIASAILVIPVMK